MGLKGMVVLGFEIAGARFLALLENAGLRNDVN
jgi:hypothetical protein